MSLSEVELCLIRDALEKPGPPCAIERMEKTLLELGYVRVADDSRKEAAELYGPIAQREHRQVVVPPPVAKE